nr:hydantoinase/oxoprolinase N-terminal domain-containing protein [Paraburkholderia sacchari]
MDIGGTFTDFVLEAGGVRHTHKRLTTPDAPERAVIEEQRWTQSTHKISRRD